MLTDLQVHGLKPTGKQYIVWDIANLGVRVSQAGKKTFVAQVGKARRKITIGHYPAMSLKDARKSFLLLRDDVPTDTLKEVLDSYRDLHLSQYKGTNRRDTTHLLYKHLDPLFSRRIAELTAKDIVKILDPMTPSMHNHMFGLFRTFLRWAERRSHIPSSPIGKLRKPYKETSRSRVLSNDELCNIWNACQSLGHFGRIVRLCILTGQRRGELASVQESWLQESNLVIPARATKNGREHVLPLSMAARQLCLEISARGSVFNAWSKPKKKLDQLSGVTAWTIHDLRRTFATRLAELGTPPHIVERLLNHSSGTFAGVAGIYNRHEYIDEMRVAMSNYDRYLTDLFSKV